MKKRLKNLKILEKINKQSLDESTLKLSHLRKEKIDLEHKHDFLREKEIVEKTLSSNQPELGITLGAFTQNLLKQREQIAIELKELSSKETIILDDIHSLYQEGKKIEKMIEETQRIILFEENKKEQKTLDQLAEIQHQGNELFR